LDPVAFYLVFIVLFGLISFGVGTVIAMGAMSAKIEREAPGGESAGSH
jgi:hypothetical protein